MVAQNEEKYLVTLKGIRSRNFSRDLPFLILSDTLPDGQVYREFPDGRIELQEVFSVGSAFKYRVLRVLRAAEAEVVRKMYGLL